MALTNKYTIEKKKREILRDLESKKLKCLRLRGTIIWKYTIDFRKKWKTILRKEKREMKYIKS